MRVTPQRAYAVGVRSADVRVTTRRANRWIGGRWELWVPDPTRPNGRHVLTSYPEQAIHQACRWVATLQRLEVAGDCS